MPAHIHVEQSTSEVLRLGIVKRLLSFRATHNPAFDSQHLGLQSLANSHQAPVTFAGWQVFINLEGIAQTGTEFSYQI